MDFFVAPPPQKSSGNELARPNTLLNNRYTFKNFVIGKSNELAAAAARGSRRSTR
jgi:chromosomal replication initiation ATPase DnaA